MNLDNCIICQVKGGELKCPSEKPYEDAYMCYEDFLNIVKEFKIIDKLPVDVEFTETDVSSLFTNKAKWHKECHLKFSRSKLEKTKERLNKQKRKSDSFDRKSKHPRVTNTIEQCIFCLGSKGTLHQCSTLTLDTNLRQMATKMQDTELLSRIAGGDLIAIDAKYHNVCLTDFRNRFRIFERRESSQFDSPEKLAESQVFAELITHIENRLEEDRNYIFKLAELHSLYVKRLSSLGFVKDVNRSRLKDKILVHFLDKCTIQSDGKHVLFVFNTGIQTLLKDEISKRDLDQEALHRAAISKQIRKDMFTGDSFKFSGRFPKQCEELSVPSSLKSLISTILYGPNITDDNMSNSRACLTICELILFNSKERPSTCDIRHSKMKREPPLPLYIGLDIHTLTRSKKIVTQLFELGISVNYERVLEIASSLSSSVCQRYRDENLVCPTQLKRELYTVGAFDNLDHNPSSSTAQGSFHGTSISIFQFPSPTNAGIGREPITVNPSSTPVESKLPESYSIVPAVTCNLDKVNVPEARAIPVESNIAFAESKESDWVTHCLSFLSRDLKKGDYVAWGAYHASREPETKIEAGISSLLPLFQEKAATVAMVKHGMSMIRTITEHCNPGQTPVMAVDQPLFALAKYIQWRWSDLFGEGSYIVMLGGLHIEMALWKMIGDLLDCSGWTSALSEANIASSGTADSFVSVSHVTKTRHAHQVSVVALSKLQRDAYRSLEEPHAHESFQTWKADGSSKIWSSCHLKWNSVIGLALTNEDYHTM